MLRAMITGSLICAVVACGDSETDAENKANLIGSWQSMCMADHSSHGGEIINILQDMEGMTYEQEKATFTEDQVTWKMITSKDSACGSEDMVMNIQATYVAGADASSPTEVEGATSIDLTPTAVSFTINDADLVAAMNMMNPCTSDFEVGVPKTPTDCPDLLPPLNSVFKTSFKATADTFQMADMDDDETGACTDSSGRGICFQDGMSMSRQ